MPPVYRIIEVCIYALLNFLPFMLLALYPFRKNLRFSDVTTAILIVLLTIVQIYGLVSGLPFSPTEISN